jgi:hypothetical protein
MPSKKIDFDVVREIALALPDVEESTIHGRSIAEGARKAFNVSGSSPVR